MAYYKQKLNIWLGKNLFCKKKQPKKQPFLGGHDSGTLAGVLTFGQELYSICIAV